MCAFVLPKLRSEPFILVTKGLVLFTEFFVLLFKFINSILKRSDWLKQFFHRIWRRS